jgi:CheY-like chemotaxis protein
MIQSEIVFLLVEDSEDDAFALKWALKKAQLTNPLHVATDGQQAIDYLSGSGKFSDRQANPLPQLVFLDLKLPYVSGFEVLEWIRNQPDLASIKVVILTGSDEGRDHQRALELNADMYLVKPAEPAELLRMFETVFGRTSS